MASTPVRCSNRLGGFLYTHNPFYLISCFLILYGLQIAAPQFGADGDGLFVRPMLLFGGMAGYTFLMAATCISVVRCCKIWEDARSIFLVVIIGLTALSTGLDEFCVSDLNFAGPLLATGGLFAILVTESILYGCRIRFPFWYRISFYVLLAVFFMMPGALGYAVRNRHNDIANWGSPIFSSLIGAALLLLIPAVRRGSAMVTDNGTPWQWPFYPLTAFVILVVLAAIRSHAIWMSFGFHGGPVRFEPFLLLPIAWSGLILLVSSDTNGAGPRSYLAMASAPLLLAAGTSDSGMTHLPIRHDLQNIFGSAYTLSMIAIAGFYFYAWLYRAKGSRFAFAISVTLIPWIGQLSEPAQAVGVQLWMFAAVSTTFMLLVAIARRRSELDWLATTIVATATILMLGKEYHQVFVASLSSIGLATFSMLAMGFLFDTELGKLLRQIAAAILLGSSVGAVAWQVGERSDLIPLAVSIGLLSVSIYYLLLVKRTSWTVVVAIHSFCLLVSAGYSSIQAGGANQAAWTIQSGVVCLAIGLTITSAKSGAPRRYLRRKKWLHGYRSGL